MLVFDFAESRHLYTNILFRKNGKFLDVGYSYHRGFVALKCVKGYTSLKRYRRIVPRQTVLTEDVIKMLSLDEKRQNRTEPKAVTKSVLLPLKDVDLITTVKKPTFEPTPLFIMMRSEDKVEVAPVLDELQLLLKNETVSISAVSIDDVLDRVDDILREQRNDEIPSEFLHKLDELGTRFGLEEQTGRVVRDNFAVLLADVAPAQPVRGVRIATGFAGAFAEELFEFISDASSIQLLTTETDAMALLPASISLCRRRISFVAFRTDRAFRRDTGAELNSRVISVSVQDFVGFQEDEVIEIYLNPIRTVIPRNKSRACAYWHFDNDTGHWSTDGCELTISGEGKLDVCRCNHLTHFAEILISKDLFSQLNESILEIISIIGCILSIIGIAVIVATAVVFKSWRSNDSNKVWLNLSSAVLLLNICFILTVYVKFDQADITCTLLGVALHYSVLATYSWMLVVAIMSYRKLVLIFTTDIRYKLLLSSVFSWGFPVLVIGILLAVAPRSYSGTFEERTPSGKFCYPTGIALYTTVFAPVGIMWFVNWCLYGIIIKSMSESKKIRRHSNTKDDTLRSASMSCLLAFICGIPWIFGFFARNIVAAYLFTLTVTFQGFILFLFFIVGSKKTRNLWIDSLRKIGRKERVTSSEVTNRSQPTGTRFYVDDSASVPLTETTKL